MTSEGADPGPDVVFLGPSLPEEEARQIHPELVVLGPARMGDVASAVLRFRPHAIGLVDGVFRSRSAVFHKELLYALDAGTWVLGASSMGALRAAECEPFGVIGVGAVFGDVAAGVIEDDDEVALLHADAELGYRHASDALVTIRAVVDDLVQAGVLTVETGARLVAVQRGRWFGDRRLRDLSSDARSLGLDDVTVAVLERVLEGPTRDPKRDDAAELVRRLAQLPAGPLPLEARPGCAPSRRFGALIARELVGPGAVRPDDIRHVAALVDPRYPDDLEAARLKVAIAKVSHALLGDLSGTEREAGAARVAASLGVDVAQLGSTMRSLDLDESGLDALVAREAHVLRLAGSDLGSLQHGAITGPYLDELRLERRYDAARAIAALHVRFGDEASMGDVDPRRLLATFSAFADTPLPYDLGAFVERAELGSTDELLQAVTLAVRAATALLGVELQDAGLGTVRIQPDPPLGSRGR
ncbi:MAG TPA: TfuA-like protein [Acidimicrobiales bacterium]|jgi:hypothetical protein|nr:TfuA-like protein [Acidimicrobiales bacterium]